MSKNVRVRFAPSPTGPLHIGGVRTALYDYLFAKQMNGTFVLRVEDTDQKRYVPGAEDYLEETLEWLGLLPDESPKQGGNYGPYRQSERKHLYQKYANFLIEKGYGYYAFDTPEELDAMRERLTAEGAKSTAYDASVRLSMRNSLTMSREDVRELMDAGEPYVIRLRVMPGEEIVVNDMVRGIVRIMSDQVDDKVLIKADGMATYHLANVVDDHLMEISHVIRGEEWLPSTPLHVLMYRYFDWTSSMPQFMHLPLILKPAPESYLNRNTLQPLSERLQSEFFKKNPDVPASYSEQALATIKQLLQDKSNVGARLKIKKKDKPEKRVLKEFLKSSLFGKLSKRDGDRLGFPVFPLSWKGEKPEDSFIGFREAGFLPDALINFLAFLGWNPGTEQEMFSMQELIEAFSVERISKSGARFSYDKSVWYNQQYIMKTDDATLAKVIRPTIEAHGHQPTAAYLETVVRLLKERVTSLTDFWNQGSYLFEDVKSYDEKTVRKKWKEETKPTFFDLKDTIGSIEDFSATNIEATVKGFIHDRELKFGDIFSILRVAMTGTTKGPSLFEIAELLGKDEIISRLETAFTAFDD